MTRIVLLGENVGVTSIWMNLCSNFNYDQLKKYTNSLNGNVIFQRDHAHRVASVEIEFETEEDAVRFALLWS